MKARKVTVKYIISGFKPVMACDMKKETWKHVDVSITKDSITLKDGNETVATWFLQHVKISGSKRKKNQML